MKEDWELLTEMKDCIGRLGETDLEVVRTFRAGKGAQASHATEIARCLTPEHGKCKADDMALLIHVRVERSEVFRQGMKEAACLIRMYSEQYSRLAELGDGGEALAFLSCLSPDDVPSWQVVYHRARGARHSITTSDSIADLALLMKDRPADFERVKACYART